MSTTMNGTAVSRDALLAWGARPTVTPVPLPGGHTAYVRPMTVAERDGLEAARYDGDRKMPTGEWLRQFRAQLLIRAACDADGNRLFGDEDLDAVKALSAEIAEPLVDAAVKVNGMAAAAEPEKNGG